MIESYFYREGQKKQKVNESPSPERRASTRRGRRSSDKNCQKGHGIVRGFRELSLENKDTPGKISIKESLCKRSRSSPWASLCCRGFISDDCDSNSDSDSAFESLETDDEIWEIYNSSDKETLPPPAPKTSTRKEGKCKNKSSKENEDGKSKPSILKNKTSAFKKVVKYKVSGENNLKSPSARNVSKKSFKPIKNDSKDKENVYFKGVTFHSKQAKKKDERKSSSPGPPQSASSPAIVTSGVTNLTKKGCGSTTVTSAESIVTSGDANVSKKVSRNTEKLRRHNTMPSTPTASKSSYSETICKDDIVVKKAATEPRGKRKSSFPQVHFDSDDDVPLKPTKIARSNPDADSLNSVSGTSMLRTPLADITNIDRDLGVKPLDFMGKQCVSCHTYHTSLWRQTEDGMDLCNACGIRWKSHHIRCSTCWYIPARNEKNFEYCPNCKSTCTIKRYNTLRRFSSSIY